MKKTLSALALILLGFVCNSASSTTLKPLPSSQTNVSEQRLLTGPSQYLYDHPYYSCLHNYYVSVGSGNDSNNGTSVTTAWQTLQHANNAVLGAGSCINVLPGTYTSGVVISNGGNYAGSKGYLVYRCTILDECIVTDVAAGGQNGSFVWNSSNMNGSSPNGSYVIIDGFTMTASTSSTQYGQGIQLSAPGSESTFSVHHIWIMNNVISGYGQSGIQMNDGDYFFSVHNTVFGNSNSGCSAQGSGISYVVEKAIPSAYTRTPDDSNNVVLGNIGNFHMAVEYNRVYNNVITSCGNSGNPYDTDGNDIIMDTFNNAGGTNVVYPYSTLVAYNVTYNGGSRGIEIFRTGNVTVANNSCYNSDLDPYNNGEFRPCIGDLASWGINYLNNISYSIPQTGGSLLLCSDQSGAANCLEYNNAFNSGAVVGQTTTSTYSGNISYCGTGFTPPTGCNAMYNSATMVVDPTFYSQITDGDAATVSSTGSYPGGIGSGTTYYLYKVGNQNIGFATTHSEAMTGYNINLYTGFTGTLTVTDTTAGHSSSSATVLNPTYSCTSNKCNTNPLWKNVGNSSHGTSTTPPVGANFALQTGSPAIGIGVTEPYLPPQAVDAGACPHQLTTCY